mgnify:CR=1 FL=1
MSPPFANHGQLMLFFRICICGAWLINYRSEISGAIAVFFRTHGTHVCFLRPAAHGTSEPQIKSRRQKNTNKIDVRRTYFPLHARHGTYNEPISGTKSLSPLSGVLDMETHAKDCSKRVTNEHVQNFPLFFNHGQLTFFSGSASAAHGSSHCTSENSGGRFSLSA